ncbi:MAG: DUF177 domain-containing protein [Dehalococcoidia bacterium]|nr:MAG: DUF177 domain-containing protein [Dehalococcoidia bacterium]
MIQENVAQLLKEPVGSTRDYELDEPVDVTGNGIGGQVKGKVRLTRTNRGILVRGMVSTGVEVTCSRCLSRSRCPLTFTIEEEYFPVIEVNSGTPLSPPDEPGSFTIDEHHILDLTEAIRQYALLTMPMKPLCREDCTGLLPKLEGRG